MTSDANAHEEFEIAALRRARGALDAGAAARLDAHLATCADCRSFAATDAATKTALRRRAAEAAAARDWPKLRDAAAKRSRHEGVQYVAVVIVSALIALRTLTISSNRIDLGDGAVVGVLFTAVPSAIWFVAWHLPRRRRRTRAEASAAGDLLRHCRFDLDAEIAELRDGRTVGSTLTSTLAIMYSYDFWSAVELEHDLPGSMHWSGHVIGLVVVVSLFCWVFRRRYVDLPRLERERRELGK